MKKKIWDLYAPIYEKAMRADYKYYKFMYDRIPTKIQNKEVLELATGPGLLAKHVAYAAKRMVATDYSEGGSIDMCRAFEEWQEECIQKGIATGIQQGIQSSRLRPLNLSPSQIRTCGFPAYGSS